LCKSTVYSYYWADELVDETGEAVAPNGEALKGHIHINTLQIWLSNYLEKQLFGGRYGWQVNIPFTSRSAAPVFFNQSFDSPGHTLSIADLYIEPFNLRWHWDRVDLFLAYGFFAPTGKFHRLTNTRNRGLGNWSQMATVASTFFWDSASTVSFSFYGTYEFHGRSRHLDFTAGQNLCVDFGFGKRLGIVTVGLVGYFEMATTYDTGSGVPEIARNLKDRVAALGPEVSIEIGPLRSKLVFRYETEFAAKGRTQGNLGVVNAVVNW
jgi:hypothetical protein